MGDWGAVCREPELLLLESVVEAEDAVMTIGSPASELVAAAVIVAGSGLLLLMVALIFGVRLAA